MISDLIGVLYFDQVDHCNSGVRSGIERLTVETVDAVSYTHLDVYKRQTLDSATGCGTIPNLITDNLN